MIYILDAGPMIAFLSGEPGSDVTAQTLLDHSGDVYAHVFNLTEVYYIFFRRGGQSAAETAILRLSDAGVILCEEADTLFWKDAATIKARHALALPDAFCLALARRRGGTILTSDHAEFDPIIPHAYCPIIFIR